jgi:hypothetical protein
MKARLSFAQKVHLSCRHHIRTGSGSDRPDVQRSKMKPMKGRSRVISHCCVSSRSLPLAVLILLKHFLSKPARLSDLYFYARSLAA